MATPRQTTPPLWHRVLAARFGTPVGTTPAQIRSVETVESAQPDVDQVIETMLRMLRGVKTWREAWRKLRILGGGGLGD